MINKKQYAMMKEVGIDLKKIFMALLGAEDDEQLTNRGLYVILILIGTIIAARNGMFDNQKEV